MSLLILSLGVGLLQVFLGVFVILRKNRSIINTVFLCLCMFMGLWSFMNAWVMWPGLVSAALLRTGFNILYLSGYLISASVLLFFTVFPSPPRRLPLGRMLWVAVTFLGLTGVILFSDWLVQAVYPLEDIVIRKISLGSGGFLAYTLLFLANMGWAVLLFLRKFRASVGLAKKQLIFVGIGLFLSLTLGAVFDVVFPLLGSLDYVLYSSLYLLPFIAFTSYAILRYRLLEIEILVKRASLYLIVVGMVAGLYASLLIVPQSLFGVHGSELSVIVMMCTAIIIAMTLQPLRDWLDRVTDKVFFQRQYNYQEVLERLSRGISSVVKLEDMLDMVANALLETFHVDRIGIYLRGQFGQPVYVCQKMQGENAERLPAQAEEDNPALVKLAQNGGVLVTGEFRHQYGHLYDGGRVLDEGKAAVQKNLDEFFESAVLVPLWLKQTLAGFILLGEKRGGEAFSNRDISLLDTVASQMVVVMENTRLYEQMLNSERLTVLGAMAASIAHEIRNPLAAIKTFIQMLPGKYENADFRSRFNEIIPGEIDRLTRITEDLLTFARPSPPAMVSTDLNEVIKRVLTLLGNQIRKRGLELSTDLGEVPEIQADAQQLTQVFMNLVLNAVQASPPGRRVHIATRIQGPEGRGRQWQQVIVSIRDEGPGIKTKDVPFIFQPYFTTKHEGTGLGLATCKRIVEAHHGQIQLESQEGQGATFFVVLPLATSADAAQA